MAENDIEVLRVIRKPPMGKLAVEVNAVQFERFADIPSPKIRQRIMAAVGDLVVFVDGYDKLVEAGMAPPASTSAAEGQAYASSMAERQEAFRTELARQRYEAELAEKAQEAVEEQKPAPVDEVSSEPDVEINLVEQIDAIFQRNLAQDPDLRGRSAKLESTPEGGLRIRVENTYYSQPKDIEDQGIRKALMLALREWEAGK